MKYFDLYFSYVGNNEVPPIFHRWTSVSIVGALLSRNIKLPFGHSYIYPNQYIMLTGTPGTRKGTAIRIGKNLLEKLGYNYIAPNKAAKEAFWDWMVKNKILEGIQYTDLEDLDLTEDLDPAPTPTQAYVAHDEFLDFIGIGDDGFITNLTNLWDNLPTYDNPKIRGKSVRIVQPTVNILSGITPSGIAETFKSLALGGGFFARMLFIHSIPTPHKITFPELPCLNLESEILTILNEIKEINGIVFLTPSVKLLLDKLYKEAPEILDSRFAFYSQRRFTHLIKLIIILAAIDLTLTPTEEHCILANTILYNTELAMPSALGEYGKSKFADISNLILTALNKAEEPLGLRHLWKLVSRDLNKYTDLLEVMQGLEMAERVQRIDNHRRGVQYLPNNDLKTRWPEGLTDFTLLLNKEHSK